MKLFVIEAPGKVKGLTKSLNSLGAGHFEVFGTRGHLFSMPRSLDPLGIDENYNEMLSEIKSKDVVLDLIEKAKKAKIIYVATDPDYEGEVIATDVEKIVKGHCKSIVRVRMTGFDKESIRSAIKNSTPINRNDANPGIARRVVDRILGATLSNPPYVYLGRVQSSLLSAIVQKDPVIGYVDASIPCSKGGTFDAKIPVTRKNKNKIEIITDKLSDLPVVDVKDEKVVKLKPSKIWDCGNTVIEVSRQTGLPVKQVVKHMQSLYEEGNLSYPRADSSNLSLSGSEHVSSLARKYGVSYVTPESIYEDDFVQGAHESPHPLSDIDVTLDLGLLSPAESVLSVIARNHLLAGNRNLFAKVSTPDLSKLDIDVSSLSWRKIEYKNLPWKITSNNSQKKTNYKKEPLDRIILRLMTDNNLGRPSTYVNHVDKFTTRGLVNEYAELTSKGKIWADWAMAVEPAFFDTKTPNRLIQAMLSGEGSVKDRIERTLDFVPDLKADFMELAKEGGNGTSDLRKIFG